MTAESSISLAEITQGQKLEGTVRKVTLSGAIVDVGAPVDGLLHISDLGDKRVTRTSDVLSEGQSITTWVKRVDLTGGRLSLTMVEPPKYTWKNLEPGMQVQGKVLRLERFGAFVDIGAQTDGLIHVSELKWLEGETSKRRGPIKREEHGRVSILGAEASQDISP